MFARLWEEHRKGCKIAIAIAVILIFTGYFYAMLQRGVWHGDAFLYRQKDGSFQGMDQYAEYVLEVIPKEEETQIVFQINGGTYQYRILEDQKGKIQIYDEDRLVFQGTSTRMGDTIMLVSDDEGLVDVLDVAVHIQGQLPAIDDLLPTNSQLYRWAVMHRPETRGNFGFVLVIAICCGVLALDLAFPNLFWYTHHGIHVDGGEPSEWYRFT